MKKRIFSLIVNFICIGSAYSSSLVYVPEKFDPKTASVLVVVHGCLQTPETIATGTGWNQKADQNNWVIIYPQVPTGSNPIDCWNWYLPENQSSKSGQLASIRADLKAWKNRLSLENRPVFILGFSSGAATVSGMLACFPSDFSAGAIHSGPSYGLATNLEEGEAVLKHGPTQKPLFRICNPANFKKPVMIVHGSLDQIVNPVNVKMIVSDFLSHASAVSEQTSEANGLKYKIRSYAVNGNLAGRTVIVDGLPHAWSGYTNNLRHHQLLGPKGKIPTHIPFFSALGPSSTDMIFEFFESVKYGLDCGSPQP